MSKFIKQMEMAALKQTLTGVRDLVVLTASRVTAQEDAFIRTTLGKKNIRLHMIKNSLTRKVLGEMGIELAPAVWEGPTLLAWGSDSVKGLSTAVDGLLKDLLKKDPKLKDNPKVKIKTAVADGQQVTFEQAKVMPTRLEAIGDLLNLILSPASTLAGQLIGPGGQVASQVQTVSEKKSDEAAASAEAGAPAAG